MRSDEANCRVEPIRMAEFYLVDWKALRSILGWSQYAASDFLGLSRSNIAAHERKGYISADAWSRIEPMVELAIELRRQAKDSPVPALPSGIAPNITATIELGVRCEE